VLDKSDSGTCFSPSTTFLPYKLSFHQFPIFMSSGNGIKGPNEAALPRNTVSSHTCDWWNDQLQWNTDLMLLIEPPKMVKMVQNLGECKIKETLILGALSRDRT